MFCRPQLADPRQPSLQDPRLQPQAVNPLQPSVALFQGQSMRPALPGGNYLAAAGPRPPPGQPRPPPNRGPHSRAHVERATLPRPSAPQRPAAPVHSRLEGLAPRRQDSPAPFSQQQGNELGQPKVHNSALQHDFLN